MADGKGGWSQWSNERTRDMIEQDDNRTEWSKNKTKQAQMEKGGVRRRGKKEWFNYIRYRW